MEQPYLPARALTGTALNLPIFGGKRKSDLAKRVLVAFQEVEDGLSDLRIFEDQSQTQTQTVDASARAPQLSRSQYNEGAVTYLDVIDAERTVLQTGRTAVQLQGPQAISTINLIRAPGGGWGEMKHAEELKISQS